MYHLERMLCWVKSFLVDVIASFFGGSQNKMEFVCKLVCVFV